YLLSQSLWTVTSSTFTQTAPSAPAADADATTKQAYEHRVDRFTDAEARWNESDDKARGAILLRMDSSIRKAVISLPTAKEVWDTLKDTFSSTQPSRVYADFLEVINMRLSGTRHPEVECARFQEIWERLDSIRASGYNLLTMLRAMLLLHALPPSWS